MKNVIMLLVIATMATSAVSAQEKTSLNKGSYKKVLLYSWKNTTTDADKIMVNQLFEDLVQEVDGFHSFSVKKLQTGNYEEAVFLNFESAEAEENYRRHPKHEALAELGAKVIADFTEFSFQE